MNRIRDGDVLPRVRGFLLARPPAATGPRTRRILRLSFLTRSRRAPADSRPSRRRHSVVGRTVTVLAAVLVFLALIVPDQISRLPEGFPIWRALIRIPVEGLVGAAL